MNAPRNLLIIVAILLAGTTASRTAVIDWIGPVDTTDKSQLIEGAIVHALNGAPNPVTIANGGASGTTTYGFTATDFTSFGPGNSFVATAGGPTPRVRTTLNVYTPSSIATTGDADFDGLVGSFTDANGTTAGITAGTLTVGGLTAGSQYLVQIFYNDQRAPSADRVMTFGDSSGNTVNVGASATPGAQTTDYGQHAVGSFTASGNSQEITMAANGFGNVHFNAIIITAAGPPPPPEVPTNLTAAPADSRIVLDWDDNAQFSFSHFIVKRSSASGGPYTSVATNAASTFTDSGLVNGTAYFYVVTAVNVDGVESAPSDEVTAIPSPPPPPEAPSNLVVTEGAGQLLLDWDDNAQTGFAYFRVKRSTTGGGPYTLIASPTASAFTDTAVVPGTTYYYVVTAVNSSNQESLPSNEDSGTPSAPSVPPNFLFILTDDQDTYSVGAYRRTEPSETNALGSVEAIDTPHIDRLAREGMLFHQARLMGGNQGAVCTPSRTMIMTGRQTWQRTVSSAADTLPGVFNRNGYDTYRTCKVGNSYDLANAEFAARNEATKRGAADGAGSDWHADNVLNYLEQWNSGGRTKPFLIYLGFSHPHDERHGRPDLLAKYHCVDISNPASISLNPGAPPLPANHLACTPATYPAHPFDHGHLNVRDEVSVDGMGQYRTEAVVRNEIGKEFACVDWIDQQIGRVLARLEDPNNDGDRSDSILENTYIVFTSDHGIAIGRHGLQGKQNLYEPTWRVPYIVRGPGIARGAETDALIYLHDTFPTFCDLADVAIPATIGPQDGQSFKAVLHGTAAVARQHVYGVYAGGSTPGMRAVTDGRWKLIKYDVGNNATQKTQLFDLKHNPFELLPEHGVPNLAEHPAFALIRQELEEQLMRQRKELNDPHAFLGDRVLFRFEEGVAGQEAVGSIQDLLPWQDNGTAKSGNGGPKPVYSSDVYAGRDSVVGASNKLSLDFEQDHQNHLEVADSRELDFGAEPFTIEAWVKFESLPTGNDAASTLPLAMKRALNATDSSIDYLFLAAAGTYGGAANFGNLALVVGPTTILSSLAILDTNWHHISVALDPARDVVRFTLDGQSDIQTTAANGSANNGPLIVGAHFNSAGQVDYAFDGLMDEFSITAGFLERAQLQPLADAPNPGPFHIHEIQPARPGIIDLTFQSDEHFLYTLWQSSSMHPASWMPVRDFIGSQRGTNQTTLSVTTDAAERSFYKLELRSPTRP